MSADSPCYNCSALQKRVYELESKLRDAKRPIYTGLGTFYPCQTCGKFYDVNSSHRCER